MEPFCEHFGGLRRLVAGGLYQQQLEFKQRQVKDALERIGKVPCRLFSPSSAGAATGSTATNWSTRLHLPLYLRGRICRPEEKAGEAGKPLSIAPAAGFHARGLFDKVVDIRRCHLQPEPSTRSGKRSAPMRWNMTFLFMMRHHSGFSA